MDGYFNRDEGILNIYATNIGAFKSLIEKAQKQAEELQKTINQLESFNLNIKLSDGKNDT